MTAPTALKREKNWKQLYLRSEKLAPAKQLGMTYPRAPDSRLADEPIFTESEQLNILFICSRNQWRSPTAERIWRNYPGLSVCSAGTSANARHPVNEADLRRADVIFVMEEKHKSRLVAAYPRLLEHQTIHVLDIPDDYKFMDPELVEQLKVSVGAILGIL